MHMELPEPSRLNKHLALALGISRREADEYIAAGRVTINHRTAVIGERVLPSDALAVDGVPLENIPPAYRYILFNKPVGYVCSRRRQGETPTMYELLDKTLHPLKPVGRLDKNSSGLLVLTNDGDFAHQMTHPKFHKIKEYEVTLDRPLQPLHRQMISDFGIMLEDGKSQLLLARLNDHDDTAWHVTMSEGRNRQIRRTFASLGYTVLKLHRTVFGGYRLGRLPSGATQDTKPLT